MDRKIALDLSRIPNELKLILEIISLDHRKTTKMVGESLQNINWKLFLELVIHHRLYPFLYGKLKLIKNVEIPSFVLESIGTYYKRNTLQMLQLSGEMEQICRVFNQNQIRLMVLKGPVLASDLYGDLSQRTCGDLDVLVPIKDLEKIDHLLRELGYEQDDYIKTILNDWKWRHHHVTYYHSEKRVKVEIHWRLNPFPGKEPDFEALWNRKRTSSLTKYPIYMLGTEDLFLFLVSHGARHGWSRLRWLVDIHQIVNKDLDWPSLIELLKKFQYLHVGGQAIILTTTLLGTRVGKEAVPLTEGIVPTCLAQDAIFYMEKMVNLHSDPVPQEVSIYHRNHLFRLMTRRQKFLFVMSFLFPYPDDAETLPLPPFFHLLYFPLRPFLWAWRKARKHALL